MMNKSFFLKFLPVIIGLLIICFQTHAGGKLMKINICGKPVLHVQLLPPGVIGMDGRLCKQNFSFGRDVARPVG